MSEFIVSARKYRPSLFNEVVGQAHVTDTLKNAIVLDQLAHAFLFNGPRGVGKTTCARILAKAINCENLQEDGEPCNTCDSCKNFSQGKSMNIHELDAASNNSVNDIRRLIDQVKYVPSSGKKSVYIIDEVHMLSSAAFNAFLKTLEEPPAHAIFILATTEKHKVLPTILSRCQKFDFKRIRIAEISAHLEEICKKENIEYEYTALQIIALKADGALRDALSIFDQIASFSQRKITYDSVIENLGVLDYEYYFRLTDSIIDAEHSNALTTLNEIIESGFDLYLFLAGFTEHFRNLLVGKTPGTIQLMETADVVKEKYLQYASRLDETILMNALQVCIETEQKFKQVSNPRLLVELSLMKLVYLKSAIEVLVSAESSEKKN